MAYLCHRRLPRGTARGGTARPQKQQAMSNRHIIETDLNSARNELSGTDSIDNDIMFWDNMSTVRHPVEPMRMAFIMVSLCTNGTASFTVDADEYAIGRNDTVLIPEGHVIDNYSSSPDFCGLTMMMSTSFFYETMRNVSDVSSMMLFSRLHPVVSLSQREADIYTSYFRLLKAKTADTANRYRRNVVQALIQALFYDFGDTVFRVRGNEGWQPRANAIFTDFIRQVELHFRSERRVSWYAGQLCISPKYLADTIKSASGRTPNEWIDKYVTMEIKLMLRNSTKSIKEIASEMNFPNQSFFGKYFKEHAGMSPSEYRKSVGRRTE